MSSQYSSKDKRSLQKQKHRAARVPEKKFKTEMVKAMPETWRDVWQDYCQLSTLHGVRDLYHAGTMALRTFWCLAVAGALTSAFYGCVAIFLQYRTYPFATIYYVQESTMRQLPDVVVCPFNRFNRSVLAQLEIDKELIEYVQMAFGMSTPYKFQREKSKMDKSTQTTLEARLDDLLDIAKTQCCVVFSNMNVSFLGFIKNVSFACNAIVKYCVIPQSGMVDCCSAEEVAMPVGMCYRIKGIEQVRSGSRFGITIILRVPDDEYLSPGMSNLHNDGFAIKLAESGKGLNFDLTFVPPGVHALAPLRATKFEFIHDPPRYECLEDPPSNYSTTMCFDECFFSVAVRHCNCRPMATQAPGYSPCMPREFSCLREQMRLERNRNPSILHDCRSACKPPCSMWQYEPIVSYTKFPSGGLYKYVPSAEEKYYKKLIVLDVFYESLAYSVVKHVPTMTIDTFVSDIGGQIGLWVGASVLTIVQVIFFLWRNLWIQVKRARIRTREVYIWLMNSTNWFTRINNKPNNSGTA